MSVSPLTIFVFLAVAVAVKLSVLVALCATVLRRGDRSPVSGAWALRGGERRALSARYDGPRLTPLARALMSLVDRDLSRLEITPSGRTVTVRSADGQVLNYGTHDSLITRRLTEDVEVQATWYRQGDTLLLESGVGEEGKIIEVYERAGEHLKAETKVTVPACGLERSFSRLYERASAGSTPRLGTDP